MMLGKMPLLPVGHMAIYFGGHKIKPLLSKWTPYSRWFLINCFLTSLFQIILFVYKTIKSKRLTRQQSLKSVLVGNFLNINSMATTTFSVLSVLFVLIRDKFIEYKSDENSLPDDIISAFIILLFFQLRPFFKNHALR